MGREINRLIIHCAASPNGASLTRGGRTAAEEIDAWHAQRAFKRGDAERRAFNPNLKSIGYHAVIDVDGMVYTGRHPDEIGAHAAGHNRDSIGVCLVGTDQFTLAQWASLKRLVEAQRQQRPNLQILGHRDIPDVHKTCPGFDVATWEIGGRTPLPGHIQQVVRTPRGAA